jgi:hypothetical protein
MSDLQPAGAKVTIEGVERTLLWDYGVIEKVQEMYGQHPVFAIEKIFWEDGKGLRHYQAKPVLDLLEILLNNEIRRQKYFDGSSDLKPYTREQLGMIVDRQNASDIVGAIVASWTGSIPGGDAEPEEEKKDSKNSKTGKR